MLVSIYKVKIKIITRKIHSFHKQKKSFSSLTENVSLGNLNHHQIISYMSWSIQIIKRNYVNNQFIDFLKKLNTIPCISTILKSLYQRLSRTMHHLHITRGVMEWGNSWRQVPYFIPSSLSSVRQRLTLTSRQKRKLSIRFFMFWCNALFFKKVIVII